MKKLIIVLSLVMSLGLVGCGSTEEVVNKAKDKGIDVVMSSLQSTENKDTLNTLLKQAREKYGDKFSYTVDVTDGQANITVKYDGQEYTTKTKVDGGLTK